MKSLIVALLLVLMSVTVTRADNPNVVMEYSFESNHTEVVIGYNVYDDGVLLDTYVSTDGVITMPCVDVPMGTSNFTIAAVYSDGSLSGVSEPYSATIPKCEVLSVITIVLETNAN